RRLLAAVVSSNYFDTLRVKLAAGRPFTPDEERPGARIPVAIATHGTWRKSGFDPAFIGRTITINSDEYTIIGITPEGFSGTLAMLSPEVFLPLGMFEAVVDNQYKNNGRGLADRSNFGLSVSPGPQNNGALATFTGFLLTLSGLVLVVACLNIANMLLARGAARRKEIAVRLALGAKRSRVIRQLLTESLLLAAIGSALGL